MATKNSRDERGGEEEDEAAASSQYRRVIFSDVGLALSRHDSFKGDPLPLFDIVYVRSDRRIQDLAHLLYYCCHLSPVGSASAVASAQPATTKHSQSKCTTESTW